MRSAFRPLSHLYNSNARVRVRRSARFIKSLTSALGSGEHIAFFESFSLTFTAINDARIPSRQRRRRSSMRKACVLLSETFLTRRRVSYPLIERRSYFLPVRRMANWLFLPSPFPPGNFHTFPLFSVSTFRTLVSVGHEILSFYTSFGA
jgi:hypothetical protein